MCTVELIFLKFNEKMEPPEHENELYIFSVGICKFVSLMEEKNKFTQVQAFPSDLLDT